MNPHPMHGRCTGLWGMRDPTVDRRAATVDGPARAGRGPAAAVDTVHPVWTTVPAATSAYTR